LPLSLGLLCQAVVGASRALSPSASCGHGGATLCGLVRREHGDGRRRQATAGDGRKCITGRGVPDGRSLSVEAVALMEEVSPSRVEMRRGRV
jgi:hypothetical protein